MIGFQAASIQFLGGLGAAFESVWAGTEFVLWSTASVLRSADTTPVMEPPEASGFDAGFDDDAIG